MISIMPSDVMTAAPSATPGVSAPAGAGTAGVPGGVSPAFLETMSFVLGSAALKTMGDKKAPLEEKKIVSADKQPGAESVAASVIPVPVPPILPELVSHDEGKGNAPAATPSESSSAVSAIQNVSTGAALKTKQASAASSSAESVSPDPTLGKSSNAPSVLSAVLPSVQEENESAAQSAPAGDAEEIEDVAVGKSDDQLPTQPAVASMADQKIISSLAQNFLPVQTSGKPVNQSPAGSAASPTSSPAASSSNFSQAIPSVSGNKDAGASLAPAVILGAMESVKGVLVSDDSDVSMPSAKKTKDEMPATGVSGTISSAAPGSAGTVKATVTSSANVSAGAGTAGSIYDQIRDHLDIQKLKQGTEINFSLSPKELGNMKMTLVIKNDSMTLQVQVDHNDVKNLVVSGMPQLRESLSSHGIRVAQFEVGVGGSFSSGQGDANAQNPASPSVPVSNARLSNQSESETPAVSQAADLHQVDYIA